MIRSRRQFPRKPWRAEGRVNERPELFKDAAEKVSDFDSDQ